MDEPPAVVCAVVVKCIEPALVARFWQTILGGRIVSYPEQGVEALRAPGITFDFVTVGDTKSGKNRLHLDLAAAEPSTLIDRALAAGATEVTNFANSADFTVMRDPEGNEFCVLSDPSARGPWSPPSQAKP